MKYLGEPKPLSVWLQESSEFPIDGYLYIKANVALISFSTLCWPGIIETLDLSNEEYDEMESSIESRGFKQFLEKEQIEDIESNLEQQIHKHSSMQFIEAINYYWQNDAFIIASEAQQK